jgi:hypothetical protein
VSGWSVGCTRKGAAVVSTGWRTRTPWAANSREAADWYDLSRRPGPSGDPVSSFQLPVQSWDYTDCAVPWSIRGIPYPPDLPDPPDLPLVRANAALAQLWR